MGLFVALFPTRWQTDRPPSIEDFMASYPDDYACAEHLAKKRWPDGFVCPHCKSDRGWRLERRPWVWECAGKGPTPGCRRQTSVIAGTVMQGTHLPLRTWFIAAYLMATHSNGISSLQLQAKLGVGSYKTAWSLLHKLRGAMINPDREPLGPEMEVEADETSIPYRTADEPVIGGQGRSSVGKLFIIGAVERATGRKAGRIRLTHLVKNDRAHIHRFVLASTAPGTILHTDKHQAYAGVPERHWQPRNLSEKNALPAHITFERIHRVFSLLKRWGAGTFHGFREKHLDLYLNEFVFRWNRRRHFSTTMDTMLGLAVRKPPTPYSAIVGDTREWRQAHRDAILAMVSPKRLDQLKAAARASRIDILDLLAQGYGKPEKGEYERKAPKRPVLSPRRPGEARPKGRYRHPPRPTLAELEAGYLRPPATRAIPA